MQPKGGSGALTEASSQSQGRVLSFSREVTLLEQAKVRCASAGQGGSSDAPIKPSSASEAIGPQWAVSFCV